jgi:hypothetical protein
VTFLPGLTQLIQLMLPNGFVTRGLFRCHISRRGR